MGLYIFLGILLFFVFLFSLRAVVTVAYSDEIALTVRVLFIKIKILPKKDKRKKIHSMSRKKAEKIKKTLDAKAEKKRIAKQRKKEKKQAQKEQEQREKESGQAKKKTLAEILDLIDLITALVKTVLKCFFGHLRVDVARFRITVAMSDPSTTAVAYGAVSQAVSYLLALLKNNKNVRGLKSADIDIRCDFLSESISADVELSFSMRVWHVFHIAFAALGTLIKKKVKSMAKQAKRPSLRSYAPTEKQSNSEK
jgi:ABC-type multidrug transport system fused ATPase/permease subunit